MHCAASSNKTSSNHIEARTFLHCSHYAEACKLHIHFIAACAWQKKYIGVPFLSNVAQSTQAALLASSLWPSHDFKSLKCAIIASFGLLTAMVKC